VGLCSCLAVHALLAGLEVELLQPWRAATAPPTQYMLPSPCVIACAHIYCHVSRFTHCLLTVHALQDRLQQGGGRACSSRPGRRPGLPPPCGCCRRLQTRAGLPAHPPPAGLAPRGVIQWAVLPLRRRLGWDMGGCAIWMRATWVGPLTHLCQSVLSAMQVSSLHD